MPELREVLPKYLQIAGHIRDQIIRGDLAPGAELPSERELALTWNVARPTITKAIATLRCQGLVQSRQGAGTFVQPTSAAPRARERYARARDHGTIYSHDETVRFLAIDIVADPPEPVLRALRLSAPASVIRRPRLITRNDGEPVELSVSWFRADLAEIAPKLLLPRRLLGGTGRYLAEVANLRATYARDRVSARLATDGEARLLGLSQPAAVLVYELITFDSADHPVQLDEATYPQHRWAFGQEYSLEP